MQFWEKFSSLKEAFDYLDENIDSTGKNLPTININSIEKHNFIFKLKSTIYLLKQDRFFFKTLIKKPLFYIYKILRSFLKSKSYIENNNIFLFNLKNLKSIDKYIQDKSYQIIWGFSYCQKPVNCPKKRFSSECIYDVNNPVCKNCYICKCANLIHKDDKFLVIPDVKYIGKELIKIHNDNKKICFVISSCDLSIKMNSDFANMLNIKGMGIKLSGRTCVNFKSFLYAEKGIKSAMTDLTSDLKKVLTDLIKARLVSKI